jgi:hypothetical protein
MTTILSGPDRFVDSDGNPINEHRLDDSQYSVIGVKRIVNSDTVEIRARNDDTDTILTIQAKLTDELYKGIEIDGPELPSDVDEDIRALVNESGYCLVDDSRVERAQS